MKAKNHPKAKNPVSNALAATDANIYTPMASRAFESSFIFGLVAVIILLFFSIGEAKTVTAFLNIFGIVIILAFASLTTGGIIGFLFGIPHTVQQNTLVNTPNNQSTQTTSQTGSTTSAQTVTATPAVSSLLAKQSKSNFTPSTNLEQIADWLTKIIVGVGLTEIHNISGYFNRSCNYLGKTLQSYSSFHQNGSLIAGGTIILFSILGFLIVYLWTYLYLIRIQDSIISPRDIIDAIDSKMADSDSKDKQATDLASKQLALADGAPDIPITNLVQVFREASKSFLSGIFYRAVTMRKQYWKDPVTKFRIEKTIPIFEALIILDNKFEIPENYAELGYVLKDKRQPDYQQALDNLNKAVDGLKQNDNNLTDKGFIFLNRAYCRIKLDPEFAKKMASTPANKQLITDDFTEARKESYVAAIVDNDPLANDPKAKDTTLIDWKALNP